MDEAPVEDDPVEPEPSEPEASDPEDVPQEDALEDEIPEVEPPAESEFVDEAPDEDEPVEPEPSDPEDVPQEDAQEDEGPDAELPGESESGDNAPVEDDPVEPEPSEPEASDPEDVPQEDALEDEGPDADLPAESESGDNAPVEDEPVEPEPSEPGTPESGHEAEHPEHADPLDGEAPGKDPPEDVEEGDASVQPDAGYADPSDVQPDTQDSDETENAPDDKETDGEEAEETVPLPGQDFEHAIMLRLNQQARGRLGEDLLQEVFYCFELQQDGKYTLRSDGISLEADLFEGPNNRIAHITPNVVPEGKTSPCWIDTTVALRRGVSYYLVVRGHLDSSGSYGILLSRYLEPDPTPIPDVAVEEGFAHPDEAEPHPEAQNDPGPEPLTKEDAGLEEPIGDDTELPPVEEPDEPDAVTDDKTALPPTEELDEDVLDESPPGATEQPAPEQEAADDQQPASGQETADVQQPEEVKPSTDDLAGAGTATGGWSQATSSDSSTEPEDEEAEEPAILSIDVASFLLSGLSTTPGDLNGDGLLGILDLESLIDFLVDVAMPDAPENADANGDLEVDILDLGWLVEHLLSRMELGGGRYKIRNLAGQYLTVLDGSLVCSSSDSHNIWELKLASNGAFYVYEESFYTQQLLDLFNNWDAEGNTVNIYGHTDYIDAQTWRFVPNEDGSYRICTVHPSGRVLTDQGQRPPVIQTYTGADTQKWILEPSNAPFRPSTKFMGVAIGTEAREVIIHQAAGHTDASLRQLLQDNADKHNLVEGSHVLLHLTNELWDGYQDPKRLLDTYDAIYQAEYELIGGKAKIYNGKLPFLTNVETSLYMYQTGNHCGQMPVAAKNNQDHWNKGEMKDALWGVGHEIGHAMTIHGMGLTYGDFEGESWVNVPNVYALKKLGLYQQAQNAVYNGFAKDFPGSAGRAYDELPDSERDVSIIKKRSYIFVKLPILLCDYYGWEGMQRFCIKAAEDHAKGISTGSSTQGKIDYMVENLSAAYGMDVSNLFERWRLYPSAGTKAKVSALPAENKIYANILPEAGQGRYKIRNKRGQYLSIINDALGCAPTDSDNIWELKAAENSAFHVYMNSVDSGQMLDLINNWDVEGNPVKIYSYTGYIEAQSWRFVPQEGGGYQIRTVNPSGRVLTENGEESPTIQTYDGQDSQIWILERVD